MKKWMEEDSGGIIKVKVKVFSMIFINLFTGCNNTGHLQFTNILVYLYCYVCGEVGYCPSPHPL